MAAGPSGTVTFLFTDIEGSTRLWESDPDAMRSALAVHDEILRAAIERHAGFVFATGGDGFAVAFARAADAVGAAADAQRALQARELPAVRMGVHVGEAAERDGDYFGPAVNRTARLMAIAHGGQVVVSGAVAPLVDGVELRDLGEHRLRDLSRPERVHQLVVDGLPDEFPDLRSLDTRPTNLPTQLTSFIGRDEDVKVVEELVREHRLLTLTGVGGVGKTRLAVQVAAEMLPEFEAGAWLCELAAAEEEDALVDVVATVLGARPRSGMSLLESVVEFLRPKELLLVVDNCEHVIDRASELVDAVLSGCPSVRVLATSREGLGIPGEKLSAVRSLATPARDAPLADIAAAAAVQLFVDRAQLAASGFALDSTNAGAVLEICRRLDGIPLAIELAAARVTSMSPGDIAALLDERFRLLTGGRRRAVERHHTLRATVDWSYALLSEIERAVFDRLGVFAGSFDAAAAQAVAADAGIEPFDVLDALGELVAKSMLVAEPVEDSTRYSLLETLRQYALEQVTARGEADHYRRRHAAYYSEFAQRIGPLLLGPDELRWRPRLAAEIDNLRVAVGWALERDDDADVELAFRLLAGIARETVLSRSYGIGGWAERALEVHGADASPFRAEVMLVAAYGAFHRGDFDGAESLAQQVLAIDPEASWASLAVSNVVAGRGAVTEAIQRVRDAAARPRLQPYDAHTVHGILAIYLSVAGRHEEAQDAAAKAVEVATAVGQPSALALAYYARGMSCMETDPVAARRDYEASIELVAQGASDVVHANAEASLALLCVNASDMQGTITHVRTAIELF
ncbi:MAG TPA: adenylate/guanylate cyclase domain-containing protein, partial [Acidimicrobiia bacterium]|nr:adenylate/guanylate cyclase domain-containing protein [Acidimicrobiia bacterium]